MPSGKPKVLFLCTGNSARSQRAEGHLRYAAGDHFEPLSAGIEPKGLNPLAIEAMQEIGIDISNQKSKDVVSFLGQYIPHIVTVCDNARERCPIFPRTFKFLHWSFEDPAVAKGSHEESWRCSDAFETRLHRGLTRSSSPPLWKHAQEHDC